MRQEPRGNKKSTTSPPTSSPRWNSPYLSSCFYLTMRFHLFNIVVLLLSSSTVATNLYKNAALPIAATENGTYSGIHAPQLSHDIFKGIVFAYTPRLQLPQSLNEAWEISRPAIEPGLVCVSLNTWLGWSVGEDCLNSNVVLPKAII